MAAPGRTRGRACRRQCSALNSGLMTSNLDSRRLQPERLMAMRWNMTSAINKHRGSPDTLERTINVLEAGEYFWCRQEGSLS